MLETIVALAIFLSSQNGDFVRASPRGDFVRMFPHLRPPPDGIHVRSDQVVYHMLSMTQTFPIEVYRFEEEDNLIRVWYRGEDLTRTRKGIAVHEFRGYAEIIVVDIDRYDYFYRYIVYQDTYLRVRT